MRQFNSIIAASHNQQMRVFFLLLAVVAVLEAKRLMIKVDPTATDVEANLSLYGKISVRLPQINAYFLDVSDEENLKRSIRSLEQLESILNVAEDREGAYGLAKPDDPRIDEQWALNALNAFEIWEISPINPDRNLTIGICDGGYRLSHEDLSGLHFYPGYNLRDDIQDITEYSGDDRHATHVIGIMTAMANNSKGIAGLANGVSILPYRVASISSWVQCIINCADLGADVINLSVLANGNDSFLYDAVNYAYNNGVFVSACGGNAGFSSIAYPGMVPNAFAVGWIQSDLTISSGSVPGPHIDVVAPGASILSTTYAPDTYENFWGCSMATPYVSASAALLKNANPNLSVQEMYDLFTSTAVDLGDVGRDDIYGYGLINPLLAIKNFNFCILVAKNVPPTFTLDPPQLVFKVLTNFTITITCAGPESYDNCTSFNVNDLPEFMNATINEESGTIIIDANLTSESGSYTVMLTATDNFRGEVTQPITIEIQSLSQAPRPVDSPSVNPTGSVSGAPELFALQFLVAIILFALF